jgi:hypothetical protein
MYSDPCKKTKVLFKKRKNIFTSICIKDPRLFFEWSPGEGENPPPELYSFVAYKALQPIARWVQVNQIFTGRN